MSTHWWEEELQGKRDAALQRTLRVLPEGALDLASNDYLGLARHPKVLAAACAAVQEYGAGARASRLVSGHTAVHARLETALAAFKITEAALVSPSGYHANLAAVTALAQPHGLVLCDKRNHASLIDACFLAKARGSRLRFYDDLAKLQSLLKNSTEQSRLIVSDAVYSMDGDLAPVPELLALAVEHDATLLLDDAHGTGVLGETGRGALEYFHVEIAECPQLVQTGTLSKALGAQGGFVAAAQPVIDWLVTSARPFIYTTGLAPAACGAALASLDIVQREPERIQRLGEVKKRLAQGLSTLGYDACEQPSPIIPVVVGEAARAVELSERLLQQNIWCPAIRPPTVPRDSSRLRVTASAVLSDAELDTVLDAFATVS